MRAETLKQIENAINDIKDFEGENADITAKKLQEQTNLSRSVLYKEHTLKVWNVNLWEERYVEKSKVEKKLENKYSKDFEVIYKQIEELNEKILNLQKKNRFLDKALEKEKKRREVREMDLEDEKIKNQKLLAELQRLENELNARR
ncbi:DUF6262 family protein [Peribacillus frigoritolerans]|uniref:DUF6262 family protein n=1 Tax=Peribacillus frigoritolerans TaxID=450367 RepID=UPI002281E4D0|nr:DUF6262 family protein [Peribacillus frigoritolerans]MCY9005720.1 DUF6262 family protein [Peribacillus frigoritolerans]